VNDRPRSKARADRRQVGGHSGYGLLVRVILENGIMSQAQVQDAMSEALAVFVTGPASNAFEKSVNEEAAQLLISALGEGRP
jgi:hypothetical protein